MALDILDQIENQLAPKFVGVEEFAESPDYCNKTLYPAQAVLLKLIFLEELTGPEEDILTNWINGGRNGTEILISPNIRERVEFLRAEGYKHFREVDLVGGRRSSKGFCTGIAMAKTMWDCLQLQDPGTYYGIDPGKEIYFSCVAGSEEQAKDFQYADLSDTIMECKSFDPYLIKSLETEIRVATNADLRRISQEKARGNRIQKDIARLRGKALAANAGTLRGSATMTVAQPMNAKILTPTGWTTNRELTVGTLLVGSDGRAQRVARIHPRGEQRAFRVKFSDGSSTVCGEDHLWTLNQKGRKGKTRPLHEFAGDLFKKNGDQVDFAKWCLPKNPVVDGTSKLPYHLSPYLLGVMLGDGSTTWRSAKFYNNDPSIIDAVSDVLPTDHSLQQRAGIGFDICNTNSKENLVIRGFKEIGAWGEKGPAKSIPEICFTMSSDDRRSLLQGLLDTDGSVSGTSVRFGSSSIRLARGVMELVRGLGGYATLYVSDRPSSKINGRVLPEQKDFCEVCISGLEGPLFRSEIKLARASSYSRYKERHRRLVDVEEIEPCEMQCITVTNADGLYITDEYIVTHNCIDEMAHMIPGESKAAADQVYNAVDPSLDQFGLDGLMFCNSSPYSKVGMFFERYEECLRPFDPRRPIDEEYDEDDVDFEPNGEPRAFTLQFPSWALFEGYQKSKHKFKGVLVGSPDWDPDEINETGDEVYSDWDKSRIKAARAKEKSNPETYKVERRGKFAEVSDAYLNPDRVDLMYAGLPYEWVYELNDPIPHLGLRPFATNKGIGAINAFRYKFHLDPSSTTAGFGFAIAHTEFFPDPEGNLQEHVVFDLLKRWQADHFPGKVIRWGVVRKEIMELAKIFMPYEITFDQHQSAEPIQELQQELTEAHINCRVYERFATAELNWKRWEVCKTAIYSQLAHAPNDTDDCKWSALELKFLQTHGGTGKYPRIDRQEIGPVQTKDIADCIAECINSLIGNSMSNRTRERLSQGVLAGGAPGGYGIGYGGDLPSGPGPPGISEYYSTKDEKTAKTYQMPSRGVLGGRRGRGNRNRARW